MAFCINCGQELADGAKFCANCGKAVNDSNSTEQRKTVYDGVIHKCPNCGEVLTSFLANCPACGFEFNTKKVNSSLTEFIEEINECDRQIANNPIPAKTGWASWGTTKRIFWVLLNIIFFGLPLIIYLYVKVFSIIIPFVRYDSTPKLTADEKRKVSLIENFPFPNERESILEALLFVKAKVSFLASEKIDKKNAYWIRLWSAKATQLYQKAEMMFKGDKAANEAYREISAQKERVAKTVKIKAITYTVLMIVIIIFLLVRNGTFDSITLSNIPLEIPETELSLVMPQIDGGKGEIVTNNSEYFTVKYYSISDADFENYKNLCKEKGFVIDVQNDGSLFDAFNSDGYNIRVTHYNSEMRVGITDNMEMSTIVWPTSDIAKQLPVPKSDYGNLYSSRDSCIIVYIGNTTVEDFNSYVYECMKKGFEKDASRTDYHFHADNKSGYDVTVEYQGFNTMFIRIDD